MKRFAIWAGPPYRNNEIFNAASVLNRDDCLAGFRALRTELMSRNWECATQDVHRARGVTPDVVLFLDMPTERAARLMGDWAGKSRRWLLLQEPATIVPRNWDLPLHGQFERIFTWDDSLVDGRRYFKVNYAVNIPGAIPANTSGKEKLCTMIAGQHASHDPHELYSEREAAVRWFERNHPADFDLYGRGWDERLFTGPRIVTVLNRVGSMRPLRRLLAPRFPSYRGPVGTKRDVLAKYKFCICYENIQGLQGYITEKIFDCFNAGCVPVYWGADNVLDHIPGDCFVDKRAHDGYDGLYRHMTCIGDAAYQAYLESAGRFLQSDKGQCFTPRQFATAIARGLAGE